MPSSFVSIAPAERATLSAIEAQGKLLEALPGIARVLNAVPAMVMILNRNRQVVLANRSLAEFVGVADARELYGLRPGELFECVHASETGRGCGTAESCTVCGALHSIQTAQLGHSQTGSCHLQRRAKSGEETLHLDVSATPLETSGERFTLLHIVNVSDRIHRQWFERAVMPQALAFATEIEVLAGMLSSPNSDPSIRGKSGVMLLSASRRLSSLLHEQRELAEAEAGECRGAYDEIFSLDLLSGAVHEVQSHEAAQNREVRLDPSSANVRINTDRRLACRILTKILLNALEATAAGGIVTLGCRIRGGNVDFWIRNAGLIPRQVQLQIFQRSFSTKGPGRGYGTHFAKLMTERCLGGTVSFQSDAEEGTTFLVRLPRNGAAKTGP